VSGHATTRVGYHRPVVDEGASGGRELPGEAEAWHRLHGLIDRLTPETAGVPGYFEEGWTAKDAVAHLGTWMAEGARQLRQIAAGTYREGELDVDAANAQHLDAMRDVPLETVHLQAAAAHGELLRAWAELPEVTPAAAAWVRKAGPDHYAEHLPRLEEWMTQLEGAPR
jgi:hypothetical protein